MILKRTTFMDEDEGVSALNSREEIDWDDVGSIYRGNSKNKLTSLNNIPINSNCDNYSKIFAHNNNNFSNQSINNNKSHSH